MSSYARLTPLQSNRKKKPLCTNPHQIPVMDGKHFIGEKTVACRKCDACIKRHLRQWTGRINAEMKTASRVDFVTLTYGHVLDGHEARLTYSDVQLMFKRLRKAGYRFKYICVGEYGDERGRAHWHLVIMWQGHPPQVRMNERIHWEFWHDPASDLPIGFVQFEAPRSTQGTAAYMIKYMQKNKTFGLESMKYSNGIGHKYICHRSREKARLGTRLFRYNQDFDCEMIEFTVEDNLNSQGELFWYTVDKHNALAEKMIDAYLEEWAILRPDEKLPKQMEAIERLEERMQEPIEHPQLALYAERHYGYTVAGRFGHVPNQDSVTERIVQKWQRDREDREILPNQVQIDMYRQVGRNRQKEKNALPPPPKRYRSRRQLLRDPVKDG